MSTTTNFFMDTNTIDFIKANYSNKAIELEERFNSTNVILEDILNNLISEAQKMQQVKQYDNVINIVKMQKNINESMISNSNLITILKLNENQEAEVDQDDQYKKNAHSENLLSYDKYLVDTKEPHNLNVDFRHKRPHAFKIQDHYVEISTWKKMLVETCKYLTKLNPDLMNSFPEDKSLNWGDTFNFNKNKELVRTGVLIEGSNVYVETSKTSLAVAHLIIKMLDKYGLPFEDYQVYLRADYTDRHESKAQ